MADNFTQVLEVALKATTDPGLRQLLETVRQLGETGELTDEQLTALTDQIGKVGSSRQAIASYAAMREEQAKLTDSTDQLGLRLKLATQNEEALRTELDQKAAATKVAVAAQDAYRASEDRTTEGTRAHAAAVRAAKAEQAAATTTYRESQQVLDDATRQYSAAADAQAGVGRQLGLLDDQLDAAGISTRDLTSAQQQLDAQSQRLSDELRSMAAQHELVAAAARREAAAEQATLSALRESLARHNAAERATEQLARAREILAQRNSTATASEQKNNQTLGISATKIAALGAAALGIGSALELARRGVGDLIDAAADFQNLDLQLDRKFGDQADAALAKINEFKAVIPGVQETFLRLKSFGLDPLNGSFDAIVNKAADLGGSMETLQGISLALGQAWAKEKLQGEEILQLVERGVPVWDLLSKATGKNVQELQKLSAEGKLGKDVIKALIDQIGKSSEGAAAALGGTLPGQINALKQQYQDFLKTIAQSGVLDYLVQQLAEVGRKVKELTDSGELQQWARDFGEGIVSTASAIKSFVGFLIDNKDAIIALGAAWGAARLSEQALSFASSLGNLTKGAGGAGIGLKGLASNAGAVAAAVVFTSGKLADLVDVIGQLIEVNETLARIEADAAEQRDANATKAETLRKELAQYAEQARLTSDQIKALSAEEQARYLDSLQSAQRYWQAVKVEADQAGDAAGKALALGKITAYTAALGKATTEIGTLAAAAKQASRDLVMEGVSTLIERLAKLRAESGSTSLALAQIVKEADFKQPTAPGILAKSLGYLRVEGQAVVDTLRAGLIDSLAELDAQSLGNFEQNAVKALQNGKLSAAELASVLDITLQASLQKLGVSANAAGASVTASGAEMIRTFGLVVNNAQASGKQIEAAFRQAVASASTRAELDALGASLEDAAKRGTLSAGEAERAMVSLRARVRELAAEANPLADAFARLGIESQQSLDAARDSAVEAFNAIVAGAREGLASQEDVRRAWVAQAQAQLDAAKDVEPWKRAALESQIEVQASIYGTTDALEQLGFKGTEAGAKITEGMVSAKAATDDATESARLATLGYGDLLYEANKGNGAAQAMLQAIKDGSDITSRAATGQQSFAAGIVATGNAAVVATSQITGLEKATEEYANAQIRRAAEISNSGGYGSQYLLDIKRSLEIQEQALIRSTEELTAKYSDQEEIARIASTAGTVGLNQAIERLQHQKKQYTDLSAEIRGPYIAAIDQAIAKINQQATAARAAAASASQASTTSSSESTSTSTTVKRTEIDVNIRTALENVKLSPQQVDQILPQLIEALKRALQTSGA